MKKLVSLLVVFIFCFGIFANAAPVNNSVDKSRQLDVINKMIDSSNQSDKNFKVEWDKEKSVPTFITGKLSEESVKDEAGAKAFLEARKDMFKLNKAEFKLNNKQMDELGMQHFKMNLTSDGIPVYGSEIIVHTNVDGTVYAVNGNVENTVPDNAWASKISINSNRAVKAAEIELNLNPKTQKYDSEPTAVPYIYNNNGEWITAYVVTLQYADPYPANMKVVVDAATGDVVKMKNEVKYTATTGTGTGVLGDTKTINIDNVSSTYYLRDLSRTAQILTYNANNGSSLPGTLMTDTDNIFNSTTQKAGVDAHYYAGKVFDYYKNVLGRNSFDNNNAAIKSTVHYQSRYNNAFWNGSQMVYGDGDGSTFIALSGALDVIGHEFTHAVTERSCNLAYENQSGALNESFSDVMGYLIEGQTSDWLMGEDIYTPNTPGDALRSMSDPTLYDQPAHMNNYQNLPNTEAGDWGGVHTNSGIPNKAFYIAATNINNNATMAKIYYRALTTYLTEYSQFIDAKNALVQAATDLFGATTAQVIADAYAAVGVGGTTPPPTQDTYEANNTTATAYGPLTSATAYNSFIYTSSDVDYYYFNTANTGTISVTLGNLAGDYDLYLLNSAGTTVAKSEKGGTTAESLSYTATTTGKFYVKVIGYSGAYSTSKAYALTATYPQGTTPPAGQWYDEAIVLQSPHNYTNNYNNTQTYSKAGAQKVQVHFSRFETESNYDYVYIKDKSGVTKAQYTGTKAAFWAEVAGDTINVNLVTDSSVTGYGYYIDKVSYYANGQLVTIDVAPNAVDNTALPSDPVMVKKDIKR